MIDFSKLGPMDADAQSALTTLDNLLTTRRKIEAEASRGAGFSIDTITALETEQAAYFRELHRVMDKIETKTR